MTDLGSERNPVEALAEEFVERFRRGERPALSEYTSRFPELAEEIRDIFPALVMLEAVRPEAGSAANLHPGGSFAPGGKRLERLGDYRILREVGRGGMGIVYEAEQESLGRHVALKVLLAHALHDPRQAQRFQREARAAARLHHTNIVPVFGVGEQDGLHYYVMQFITGQGLDQILTELNRLRQGADAPTASAPEEQRTPARNFGDTASAVAAARSLLTGVFAIPSRDDAKSEAASVPASQLVVSSPSSADGVSGPTERVKLSDSGRPYWQSVARIGIQVAEALGYAHAQGTLHRDIKPANLLLDTQGIVWITDFGLAKGNDSEDLTHTGDVVGTLRYLAPERFQGKGDARSDLYALGLTLYELLTLRPAFCEADRSKLVHQVMHEEPPAPRKLNPVVPRDLETIVLKAIAREPAHRYQDAAELADDLRRFMDDKPIHARPVSETEKLWRWGRRNPSLALLAILFVVTLTFGSVGIAWKWREAEERRAEADEQKLKVTRAERETARQRDGAIEAHSTSQRVLAGALLDKGTSLAEKGEIGDGLFWMLEALKVVPEDAHDLGHVIRTNLASWMEHTYETRHIIEQPKAVHWCTFSPDGKHFFTGSDDVVQCWDTATGGPVGNPLPLGGDVCMALSPDGKTIVAGVNPRGGKAPQAQRREARTGQPIGPALPHPVPVGAVAFSPDGKHFFTGCHDGKVRQWDAVTGKLVGEPFRQDRFIVNALDISPDGKTLAVAAAGPDSPFAPGAAVLCDQASGKRIGAPLQHKDVLRSVKFSPNGKTVLSASLDGTAQLWDATTGLPFGPSMRHPDGVLTARFTPDGRTILTGCRDGVIRFWDAGTGNELSKSLLISKLGVRDLALSPDGTMLLAASGWETSSGTITVCRRPQGLSRPATKSRDVSLRTSWVIHHAGGWFNRQFVGYSPDARLVLTGGNDGFAKMSDAATGQPANLSGAESGPFRHAYESARVTAFSPDGRFFATSSRDSAARGDARLWDAATGRAIGPPLAQINHVAAIAFSPDGKILATGGYDCAVQFWGTANGARLGPVLSQRDIVLTLAFSPDGKTLAVGHAADYSGSTGTILWDVVSRKPVGQPMPGPHIMICFSPDGSRVLTAAGSSLRQWDAATGAPIGPTLVEPATINRLVFRPDGQMILLGCADGTVRLRELSTGKTVGAPMLYPFQANAVSFSPDPQGKLILAGYADGSARIWDRATQRSLGPPVFQPLPIFAVAFAPDGRTFLTTAADGNTRRWPVPLPTHDDLEQLALRLPVRTALEMGEGQTVVQLAPAEWKLRREFLAAHPGAPAAISAHDQAVHEARTRDAEQDSDWFAAKWHLDRQIAAQHQEGAPSTWLLYARRARAQMADGTGLDQTAADYDRARKLGSAVLLANWYRHCLADCRAAKNWSAALWYVDRLIAAEPNDWRLFKDRADVHAKLNHKEEREADLAQAAKLGADSDFLIQLAEEHAGRGEWKQSASAFELARARGPMPLAAAHAHILVCLKNGDRASFRQICAGLLDKAAPTPSPDLANGLAWICVMGPDAVADYSKPIAFAELAVVKATPGAKANVLNTLGAILYRAGRYRDAIARLKEGIKIRNDEGVVHDWIFLAMAHHQLGERAEARKFLGKTALFSVENQPFSWDLIEIDLLRREAKTLIDGAKAEPKK